MKVSARTRNAAARLCSMAASNPLPSWCVSKQALGSSRGASELADLALDYVWRNATAHTVAEATAEAESLLRTGWSP